jgi:hypothetical protein
MLSTKEFHKINVFEGKLLGIISLLKWPIWIICLKIEMAISL